MSRTRRSAMEVEVPEEKIDAIEEEEEVEEEEEEVVEEEVEEDEVEEEEEEEVEEEVEDGDDAGQQEGEPIEKGVDKVVSVGEDMKQSDPARDSSTSSAGKLFVGGVARETTEGTFTNHFKKYGEITDSVIMKDRHTQMPRGFGFVTYADPSVLDKVLAEEHVIDGKSVDVKRTVPREDTASKGSQKTKKIFVGGIPTSVTEDEFKGHFASYGNIVEHQIMVDHSTGRSRGFGFITFEDEETVDNIISKGKMHDFAGKQVEIKKAEPKKAGEPGFSGRAAYGPGGGTARSMARGGAVGYAGDYGSGGAYYGGRGGGFNRGYGYGGEVAYGTSFGPSFGGPMYAGGGYIAGNGYGPPGGYTGAYNGYGSGRGSGGRYHPYGR